MPKITRTDAWYRIRLSKFFEQYYLEYEDDIRWFTDPAPNQWLFDIPELKTRVELTCDAKGNVTVQEYNMKGFDY